jgi:5-methylcytosine-specific restriction endonuclease McrA
MVATSRQCRKCKPTYDRTPEHREKMIRATTGKPKPWLKGKKRPRVARKIRQWWTHERREQRRKEALARNPTARYHGLSARAAKAIREAVGHCEKCGHDGSESHLDVHHRDRDKRNQTLSNLAVLCHRCHMKEHGERGDLGHNRSSI